MPTPYGFVETVNLECPHCGGERHEAGGRHARYHCPHCRAWIIGTFFTTNGSVYRWTMPEVPADDDMRWLAAMRNDRAAEALL